jgi:hypothetical protein
VASPRDDSAEEAIRIVEYAESKGVALRLLGGVAIYLRCPSARRGDLARSHGDIDLIGHERQSAEIRRLFGELGYLPREKFNAMNGGRRLIFNDPAQQRRVDVFLDVFEMCHRFDLKRRLEIDRQTIPLADLLATKLQIIQTNEKDVRDIICIMMDYEVGDSDAQETINGEYLARLCSEDWGIYKTFTMKLAMLGLVADKWEMNEDERAVVIKRIGQLQEAIERAPKSLAWRVRAAIGDRVRWYELPEEDVGLVEQVQAKES